MSVLGIVAAATLAWPQTRAEVSSYKETSTYADVMSFLKSVDDLSPLASLSTIGASTEGRAIPQLVIAKPPVANRSQVGHRLVVYIQANIHAGEVEGKESALKLARELCQGNHDDLLKTMVFVINPIYNADGNEKFAPQAKNRPGQNGPESVGVRPNGQGLDLNRDCMKAESPEMRAVLKDVYGRWNPDIVFDLHTTDGTRHGYALTYSPPLHPDTPKAILDYTRDTLLPDVRTALRTRYGMQTFDYGNTAGPEGSIRWETFGYEGRYVTNYAGLTGRIAILSEATTYLTFHDRIEATDRFVLACLSHMSKDRDKILALRADTAKPSSFGTRFEMAESRTEPVLLEDLAQGERPKPGPITKIKSLTMTVFDRFKAARNTTVTRYYVPRHLFGVVRLLRLHNVPLTPAEGSAQLTYFTVSKCTADSFPFQGHKLLHIEGQFGAPTSSTVAGYFVEPSPLTAALLEPESLDGVAAWGFLGDQIAGQYPIAKVMG